MEQCVYPSDVVVWFFYSLPCIRIVKHYLPCTNSIVTVNLPKYGRSLPMSGRTDTIFFHKAHGRCFSKLGGQKLIQLVSFITFQRPLDYSFVNERSRNCLYLMRPDWQRTFFEQLLFRIRRFFKIIPWRKMVATLLFMVAPSYVVRKRDLFLRINIS